MDKFTMDKFKKNSRFAALLEEKVPDNSKNERQKKIEKSDNFVKNNNQPRDASYFQKSYREKMEEMIKKKESIKKIEEETRKEQEKRDALAMESFPVLVYSKPKVIENTTNFLDKLKMNKKVDIPVKNVLKQGWTELTRDNVTNSTRMFSNIKKNEDTKTDGDLAYDVLDHLVCLHEQRKDEYIQSWGQDEWDRMFTFSNYDYHYFDRLDELYPDSEGDSEEDESPEK